MKIPITSVIRPIRLSGRVRHASLLRSGLGKAPFPVIQSCPGPTCPCAETPPGLDIDRITPLNGTAPAYSEQLLLSTGNADWPGKLEDDAGDAAVAGFKALFGRGGKYNDPYHRVMITNSSLKPSPSSETDPVKRSATSTSAYLFPSFKYIPRLRTDAAALDEFTRAFLLPTAGPNAETGTGRARADDQTTLRREPGLQKLFPAVRDVDEILVLICGHGKRDSRCGILGPILAAEFEDKLASAGVEVLRDGDDDGAGAMTQGSEDRRDGSRPRARVGLISHIGGHKFAGNVILYIPPRFATRKHAVGGAAGNSLSGMGIWYGRVEPAHVQGLVDETILGGRVVMDLFRGGVGRRGEVLRI